MTGGLFVHRSSLFSFHILLYYFIKDYILYINILTLHCFLCFLQTMQMSHRPVQWLAVMLLVVFTVGRCQQNER